MSRLGQAVARCAVRLVPAGRRDWAEAVWAEAGQAPPGLARLSWRAGGVRLIAREALLARRAARALVFAAAAGWIVHVAWPGPAGNPATGVNRLNVATLLPVLAGLPLLARWLFGPAAPGPVARVLRTGAYAAVLALTLAKAVVEQVADNPAIVPHLGSDASVPLKTGMMYTWLVESIFLLVMTMYLTVLLALTARRLRVTTATLAAGTGVGIVLGAVMYAMFPLGFGEYATSPWLHGLPLDLVVLLAWVVLLGGPVLAGFAAARCHRGQGSQKQVAEARIRQAVVAGVLAAAGGAMLVTVLGTVTIALMARAGWAAHWLYPGQHLPAALAYHHEITASVHAVNYGIVLLVFPVIGLIMGLAGGGFAAGPTAQPAGSPPGGGGPPRPPGHPTQDPPGGIRLAGASTGEPVAGLPGFAGDGPDRAVAELPLMIQAAGHAQERSGRPGHRPDQAP